MTREKAIKIVKEFINGTHLHLADQEALETLIPELTESEDEKIRKGLINHLKELRDWKVGTMSPIKVKEHYDAWIAYLEKQKDASKAIEAVDRIDKYIGEHVANAHDMKDSNPDKKYYQGWDDVLAIMAGILQDVYSDEKQQEQPTNEEMLRTLRVEYEKGVADTIAKYEQKEQKCALNFDVISSWLRDHANNYINGEFNEFHHCVEYDGTINTEKLIADLKVAVDSGTFDVYEQKAQRPNIELIQRSWYMEGYDDRKFGKEPKWVIKTGDGDPKYEENPKYGQMLEAEQKPEEKPINWSGLTWEDINELEDIINKVHYEFRNGIGQESFGKEVLEQFREYKGDEYLDGIEEKPVEWSKQSIIDTLTKWLTEKIAPLHKKSLDGTITEKEEMFEAALLEMRSLVNSPDFQIGKDTSAEWSEDVIRKAVKEVGLTQHQIDWFKTNVFPPKQEWSEEDERKIEELKTFISQSNGFNKENRKKAFDMIDALRSHWKPSEE